MSPANGPRLTPAESLRAVDVAAQQREIAAVHHQPGAHNDAIDALAKRRVCPFDGGNVARLRIEQDRSDLAPGRAFGHAVEGAKLERDLDALGVRELKATHERACTLAGEAAMEAFDAKQPRGDVIVARNEEPSLARDGAGDEPKLMMAIRIAE